MDSLTGDKVHRRPGVRAKSQAEGRNDHPSRYNPSATAPAVREARELAILAQRRLLRGERRKLAAGGRFGRYLETPTLYDLSHP